MLLSFIFFLWEFYRNDLFYMIDYNKYEASIAEEVQSVVHFELTSTKQNRNRINSEAMLSHLKNSFSFMFMC